MPKHRSLSFIWPPPRDGDLAVYPHRHLADRIPLDGNEQLHFRCLFDLSARKVYHAPDVTTRPVSSYLAFSPLPQFVPTRKLVAPRRGGIFSVALSVPGFTRGLPVRKYGALCCPDFPLRTYMRSDKAACISKIQNKGNKFPNSSRHSHSHSRTHSLSHSHSH